MKNKSKIIRRMSAMLVAVLCICMLCVPAFASKAEGEEELLDYGIFEQRDYRKFWNGSFASKFSSVVVDADGNICFFTDPLFATEISSSVIRFKTASTVNVILHVSDSWSPSFALGSFWANFPIYDSSGNQIYTPTVLGEVDSITGMLDYGGFVARDYRDFVFGSLADCFPYVAVTRDIIYLSSEPSDVYLLGQNVLFNQRNLIHFNYNGMGGELIPNEFWYNHNITDNQGNVVYRTYPVPRPFDYVTKYAEILGIQFSVLSLVEVIAYIAGAVVLFVFLWWGVRKAVRVIMSGFKKGKLRL